jgi:hypothetical protein
MNSILPVEDQSKAVGLAGWPLAPQLWASESLAMESSLLAERADEKSLMLLVHGA